MRSRGVVARVPAKVNLQLSVGPLGSDGFHEVTTVFQAISLFDDVTVATAPDGEGIKISISGQTSSGVPADNSNLAVKAAELMIKNYDLRNYAGNKCGSRANYRIRFNAAFPSN